MEYKEKTESLLIQARDGLRALIMLGIDPYEVDMYIDHINQIANDNDILFKVSKDDMVTNPMYERWVLDSYADIYQWRPVQQEGGGNAIVSHESESDYDTPSDLEQWAKERKHPDYDTESESY